MTWISASDPLALLALQGSILTPFIEEAANGNSQLDTKQRAAKIGEPIPVVFCRRRNNAGGVLISPPATEARFENSATNEVTAYYHLVLSEGDVGSVEVRDVFQRNCRRGSFNQTYNRRAGTWDPGNAIVPRSGYNVPQAPRYCGTVGTYPDISTMSYQVTAPNESDEWNRQVHIFMRAGIPVVRLFDNVTGPSDNFCDLYRWALRATGKVPDALIDIPSLQKSAAFLEKQGFTCNVWSQQSENLGDLFASWLKYFLLGETNVNGKRGLLPLLPITQQGDFVTDPIIPVYTFNDDFILPGSFEVNYTSFADRQSFCAQLQWRQQPEDDVGLVRTSEVRYSGRALTGPYESHDLSEFATNETHVVKVGAYMISRRYRVDHTAKFNVRPEAHNKTLKRGDIVRVRIRRETVGGGLDYFDWLEQILRITKSASGLVTYEVEHFPVDSAGRSLVIRDILAAEPTGIVISNPRTGPSCDINSSTDTTVPEDLGRSDVEEIPATEIPPFSAGEISGPGFDGATGAGGVGAGGSPGGDGTTPSDGLDSVSPDVPLTTWPKDEEDEEDKKEPGSAVVMPASPCGPGETPEWRWLKNGVTVPGRTSNYYVIGTAEIKVGGKTIRGQYRCTKNTRWVDTNTVELDELVPLQGEWQYYTAVYLSGANGAVGFGAYSGPQWFSYIPNFRITKESGAPATLENGTIDILDEQDAVVFTYSYWDKLPIVEVLASRYRPNSNAEWQVRNYDGQFASPGQPWIP